MRKYPDPDLLEETTLGYLYWNHSKNPIGIQVEQTELTIEVTLIQSFKGRGTKELSIGTVKLNPMSSEQVEEYILDCIEKFINN